MTEKVPVTVLTGFLGSGKTTLLNRILSEEHGLRIAVIENEFGEIGIDQDLIINADEEFIEFNNGCICCKVRGDLIRILTDFAERKEKFDRVILETTGLADPGPVAQTFLVDPTVRDAYTIDGVITLIDSRHVVNHLDKNTDEVLSQIAFADRIILNKMDLVEEGELQNLEARVTKINQMADVYRATMADAPIDELLDIGGFNLDHALEVNPKFLEPEYPFEWGGIWELPAGEFCFKLQNGHDPDIALIISEADKVSKDALLKKAEELYVEFSSEPELLTSGDEVSELNKYYRLRLQESDFYEFKFNLKEPKNLVVFCQHMPDEFDMKLLGPHEIVIETSVDCHFHAGHSHDDHVGSISIELPGLLDINRINLWLQVFVKARGEELYRMKGILAVKGSDNYVVFQGVHMLFGTVQGKSLGDEEPVSRLVFIGKDLDETVIIKSLEACLASAENTKLSLKF
ncbi:MAG: GTP-binding protein [Lentisphaerales bacterium]|nr:GTP-binding protein [Lentisphaerales bacterium]